MVLVNLKSVRTKWWCVVAIVMAAMVMQVTTLNGPNVCMVKQKYNITKRVKYRAPMSVRTYEWCFSMPPRCSKWNTEMRDLTRLETEERTAEVAVCCPGYKMRDVSCVPICPNGKTGPRCSEDCPQNRWGPNCVNECPRCQHGDCSPVTGQCHCQRGWQGESCELRIITTTTTTTAATTAEAPLITYTSTKTSSLPTTHTTPVSTTTETKTTAKTTAVTLPAFTTPTATTSVAITTIVSTVASTKITSPMTSEKTTEVLQPITESHKTVLQTTTESYKQPISISSTKPIKAVVKESLQTISLYNKTDNVLPAPSIDLKILPTVVSNNIIKETEVTYASTTFNTNGEHKETATTATSASVKTTTPHMTAPFTVVLLTEPKNTEKKIVTTISTTSPTIKLSPTTEIAAVNSEITKPTIVTMSKETTIIPVIVKETKTETTKKPETTLKISTTTKFKPKEIWIKPAQKGEPIEAKKITYDVLKQRVATNKDFTTNTTPKTIIVSIIPTSVSYATFKKIALTTAAFIAQKSNTTMKSYNKSTEGFTKPMSTPTYTTPATVKTMATTTIENTKLDEILVKDLPSQAVTLKDTTPSKDINKTNSMTEKDYVKKSNTSAISSINTIQTTDKKSLLTNPIVSTTPVSIKSNPVHKHIKERKNITKIATKTTTKVVVEKKSNHTKMLTNYKVTTEDPTDEETFHILTEPEHITAVMGEKETGRTSIDLISVISIAGGVMMAVITMAVVIVMIERCRRPRYEDVRKINDIRMQVMIEGNDAPPPYVRSIFHTPLPEPPMSEKCHYQPISTLDRNLKQFMRPVVVQTISPIMLENFRGILECHYDHLPRRSHDFVSMEARCSLMPSMSECGELHNIQRTVRDSTLESLKCEAKLDVIDTTTSEPLYAEIPCWRPPSEHAIEILALNGEAVTEL